VLPLALGVVGAEAEKFIPSSSNCQENTSHPKLGVYLLRGCIVFGIIVVEDRVLDKCTDSSRGFVGVIAKGGTLYWLIVEEDRTADQQMASSSS
jgi:hypothetical protein